MLRRTSVTSRLRNSVLALTLLAFLALVAACTSSGSSALDGSQGNVASDGSRSPSGRADPQTEGNSGPWGDDGVPQSRDFPDEQTTGVPPGIALEQSGSVEVKQDGGVVEGLHITGVITVAADDVVIRNTKITHRGLITIRNYGENLLVEDVEIDGQGKANPVIAFNNYTLRRVNIYNVAEGPRIAGGSVTIEDSYIHHLAPDGETHTDVIQVMAGDDIVVRGNNLQSYNPDSDYLGNAAFMFGETDGPVRSCLVEGNLMNGGNYTVNGASDEDDPDGSTCTFRDNAFQRDSRYGPAANLGPNVDWHRPSNVWLGTREPVL